MAVRPDPPLGRPGWGGGKRNATTISLAPLDPAETAQLIAELLERSWPAAPGDFLCECGRDGCRRRATLSLPAYHRVRGGDGAVLARECARAGSRPRRPGRRLHVFGPETRDSTRTVA